MMACRRRGSFEVKHERCKEKSPYGLEQLGLLGCCRYGRNCP